MEKLVKNAIFCLFLHSPWHPLPPVEPNAHLGAQKVIFCMIFAKLFGFD